MARRLLTATIALLACLLVAAGGGAQEARPAAISGEETLRVAEALAAGLAGDSRIPSQVEVKTSDGSLVKVSAADALYLFCQAISEWQAANSLPLAVPLPSRPMSPSEIPIAPQPGDSRVVASADLVAQCRPVAELMRQIGRAPAGVWAGEVRLTPAEYLGALATLLQQFQYYHTFPEQIGVRPYLPPREWLGGEEKPESGVGSADRPRWPGPLPTNAREHPEAAPAPPPKLVVLPGKGAQLQGIAELAIYYQGPEALLCVRVNGRTVAISNRAPFTFRWDTRLEPDGAIRVRVEATGATGAVLARSEQEYTLANGNVLPRS